MAVEITKEYGKSGYHKDSPAILLQQLYDKIIELMNKDIN